MSYDIFYDKAFLKVDNNRVIPFYQSGSSNCTMYSDKGREVRERSWHNDSFYSESNIIIENEKLLKAIDGNRLKTIESYKDNDITDVDKHYGSHICLKLFGRKSCTFKEYKNFYAYGIKNAKTIEEYLEYGVRFSIEPYIYDLKTLNHDIEIKPAMEFKSTEHMVEAISQYLIYYEGTQVHLYINIDNEYSLKRMRKRISLEAASKREPKKVLTEKFYTIALNEGGGFFARFTRYGYKYGFYPYKKFETEIKAQKYLGKMRSKDHFKVKYIE